WRENMVARILREPVCEPAGGGPRRQHKNVSQQRPERLWFFCVGYALCVTSGSCHGDTLSPPGGGVWRLALRARHPPPTLTLLVSGPALLGFGLGVRPFPASRDGGLRASRGYAASSGVVAHLIQSSSLDVRGPESLRNPASPHPAPGSVRL